MDERLLNLLLALVTGRGGWSSDKEDIHINKGDLWDCGPWMDFIAEHFYDCIVNIINKDVVDLRRFGIDIDFETKVLCRKFYMVKGRQVSQFVK